LHSKGPSGLPPRLSDADLERLATAPGHGAGSHGLPVYRSKAMAAFVASQRDWLVVERLPAYAPELNPVERVWANLKGGSDRPARGRRPRPCLRAGRGQGAGGLQHRTAL
jgi:transposase